MTKVVFPVKVDKLSFTEWKRQVMFHEGVLRERTWYFTAYGIYCDRVEKGHWPAEKLYTQSVLKTGDIDD